MEEIWKPIKGFETEYEVSNTGQVRSIDRMVKQKNNCYRSVKGKVMKHFIDDTGYPRIALRANIKYKVHRLVAMAFIPNPDDKPEVNHIDHNRRNANAQNLEWCTAKENAQHCRNAGRRNNPKGFNSKLSIAVKAINIKTGEEKIFGSQKDAARQLGLWQTHVNGTITGRCKSTGGYTFVPL